MVPPDVGLVGGLRPDQRAGDGRDGGLVEDDLAAGHGRVERGRVQDAALGHRDPVPPRVEPCREPGREIVDDGDLVAPREQAADQMVTDESGPAGDENPHACLPGCRRGPACCRPDEAPWSRA